MFVYVVKSLKFNIFHLLLILLLFCNFIATQYVRCGNKQPLWCCRNAFTINNECVYALCSECYGNADDENKVKRGRARAFNSSFNCNDAHSNNHFLSNLEPFMDEQYLQESYLAKKISSGAILPQKCSNCNLLITSGDLKF